VGAGSLKNGGETGEHRVLSHNGNEKKLTLQKDYIRSVLGGKSEGGEIGTNAIWMKKREEGNIRPENFTKEKRGIEKDAAKWGGAKLRLRNRRHLKKGQSVESGGKLFLVLDQVERGGMGTKREEVRVSEGAK